MLINVTSTDQTFDISISEGGASVIVEGQGRRQPQTFGREGHGIQENSSIIRVSDTIFHAF
jgi:hypothetical protein